MIGGSYQPVNDSFTGTLAISALRSLSFDIAFLCCSAIDVDRRSISVASEAYSQMQKEVISNTRRRYVVADTSKFRPNAFMQTARFDQISGIITNREVDSEIVTQLEDDESGACAGMTKTGVSLAVEGLRKSWGATEVLTGIDFDIEPGGFLTLLGPSGCGKSTALRLVSGLDEVSGGNILIDGKDVTKMPADQRDIGMVFQNYALFPHMTVAENIAYGLKVRKVAKPVRQASLERVAELMSLGPLLDRKPAQLSGGQQQRVALARVSGV